MTNSEEIESSLTSFGLPEIFEQYKISWLKFPSIYENLKSH